MTISDATWKLPAHTEAKHRLLRAYLNAWFPIIIKNESRVAFIDGFAGPGRYKGGEPGSPIVAIETLVDHASFDRMDCTFLFKFIEAEPARAMLLEQNLTQLEADRGGLPKNVQWGVEQCAFMQSVHAFLDGLEANRRLIPAVALVDPFGFSGVPMKDIGQFLRWPKCEVIFNLMFDSINRFATAGNVDRHLEELFGSAEYRNAPSSGLPRRQFLVDLYMRQLRDVGGFDYVRALEMVNDRGRTGNYLVFGTHHPRGLTCMKRAMWELDPEHGTRFSVDDQLQTSLYGPGLFGTGPDLGPLRTQLIGQFAGQAVRIDMVEKFVREQTDFLEDSHLKRKTLAPMQTDGAIANVEGQKRKGTFPPGSVVHFA